MCRTGTASAWTLKLLIPEYPLPRSLHYSQILRASQAPWRTASNARQSPRGLEGAVQPFLASLLVLAGHSVALAHAYPEPHQICLSSDSCSPRGPRAVPPFLLHATTWTLSPAARMSSSATATGPTVKSASRVPLIPVTVARQTQTLSTLRGWLPGKSCGPARSPS